MPTINFPWHSVLRLGISEASHGHYCASCIVSASQGAIAPTGKLYTVLLQAGQGLPRKVAAWHGSDDHTHTSERGLSAALPITEVSQQSTQALRNVQ